MYIWKLERSPETCDYDETHALVVAAEYEQRAREIAHDEARGDQDPNVWFAPSTEVTAVGSVLEGQGSGIILADYHAG